MTNPEGLRRAMFGSAEYNRSNETRPFTERVMDIWQRKTAGGALHEALKAELSYRLKTPLSLVDGARLCLAVLDKDGKTLQWCAELPMALDHSIDNAIDALVVSYEVSSLRPCAPKEPPPTEGPPPAASA